MNDLYAFPQRVCENCDDPVGHMDETYRGMPLRDYFAGQALAGLASACDSCGTWTGNFKEAAEETYRLADAMMEARNA